jgi:hypothetical protein
MDAFSKNKYLFWSVIILAVINIVLISMFWLNRPGHHNGPMPPMPFERPMGDKDNMMNFIKHEIGLDADQEKKFDEESKAHFAKIDEITKKIGDKKAELIEATFLDNSIEDCKKMASELGALHVEFENINIDHFNRLKSFCNDKQISKFKDMMKEVFSKKGHQMMPGGPPPPMGPPPHEGRDGDCPPRGHMPPPPGL